LATRPNETWAMDVVHDQLATGRKLWVLTIIDTFSRFSPAIEPRFNFRGPDVVEILEGGRPTKRIPESNPSRVQSLSHAISTSGLISAVRDRASEDEGQRVPTASNSS
jgi:transposase InsO family protein